MNWKKIIGWMLVIPMFAALILALIVGVVGWLAFLSELFSGNRDAIIAAWVTAGIVALVLLGRLGIKLIDE